MGRALHITNGDSAADIIKRTRVQGDVLAWRDPMHHGPFPAGLALADLSRVRARYLAGPEADPSDAETAFQLRDQMLAEVVGYDRVVLWFEHDLLDQLQIVQILDWFSGADCGDTPLELICIDQFPGMPRFRGIGELDAGQMESLFAGRVAVTRAALAVAASGWAAFRSDDPRDLLAFLEGDISALPFLEAALRRHLEEFPSAEMGLSRTERQLLGLCRAGRRGPTDLFVANMALETALFIGDWRTYATLGALCESGLLGCEPAPFEFPPGSAIAAHRFGDQRLYLTALGRSVLDGERQAFDVMRRDEWLGGVHVRSGDAMWTWDGDAGGFARRAALS